ncbi:septum formation initiator family protein [Rhodococcus sp. NPDC058521]|uniref:FtsB family cell division protein n=1 Tax=Rhodococcus sp. NPDC058521 TaxID=3346536 RepID=UPI00364DA210
MAQRGTPRSPGGPGGRGSGRPERSRRTRGVTSGGARSPRKSKSAAGDARADAVDPAEAGTVLPGRAKPRKVDAKPKSKNLAPEHTILGLSTGRALILAVVVLVLALTLAVPLRNYMTQRGEAERVAAERVELETQLAELRILEERYTDPAYVEAQARQRLRFVKPGDTPFQVQLPGDYKEPVRPEEEDEKLPGPWYRDLWKTISEPQPVPAPPEPPLPGPAAPPGPEIPPPLEPGEPAG